MAILLATCFAVSVISNPKLENKIFIMTAIPITMITLLKSFSLIVMVSLVFIMSILKCDQSLSLILILISVTNKLIGVAIEYALDIIDYP